MADTMADTMADKMADKMADTMAAETQKTGADDSVKIVLIGATGSGKSFSGNTILGKKHFPSQASGKSVTLKCQSATEMINSRQVTVVDTPGWDCTELPFDGVANEIENALKDLHVPYSFLLVIRVGSVEFEEISKIHKLEDIPFIGTSFLKHTTILFSHSDNLEWKTFDEFLKEGGKEFQELLECCSNRCHSWNNRNNRCDEDVEKVLKDLKNTEMKDPPPVKPFQDTRHKSTFETSSEQKGDNSKRFKQETSAPMDVQTSAQLSETPIRILFVGMSKMGKTSTIRTLQSKGEQTEDKDVYRFSSAEWSLQLIDSPGFDENPKQIEEAISKSLSNPGPHVIIIVMTTDRFSPATKRTMQQVQDVLGQNATKHAMILFTGKDNLEGKPIEGFVKENPDLKELVKKNGKRFHAVNNRDTSDQEVDELLQKIVNIYKDNKGKAYEPERESSDRVHKTEGKESNQGGLFGFSFPNIF